MSRENHEPTVPQWQVGDLARLRVTGCTEVHLARCISLDAGGGPVFRILDDPHWMPYKLKPGDYVLCDQERTTEAGEGEL